VSFEEKEEISKVISLEEFTALDSDKMNDSFVSLEKKM